MRLYLDKYFGIFSFIIFITFFSIFFYILAGKLVKISLTKFWEFPIYNLSIILTQKDYEFNGVLKKNNYYIFNISHYLTFDCFVKKIKEKIYNSSCLPTYVENRPFILNIYLIK